MLEETLRRAILTLTGDKPYSEIAFQKWRDDLESVATDTLSRLIVEYRNAMTAHPDATIENLDELVSALKQSADVRNLLCHGVWQNEGPDGASKIIFRKMDRQSKSLYTFTGQVDSMFLMAQQNRTANLIGVVA